MVNELGDIAERAQVVEQKLEQLAASVTSRFNGVDEAFADQRLYTELTVAHVGLNIDRLDARMEARFSRLERRLEQVINLHLAKALPAETG